MAACGGRWCVRSLPGGVLWRSRYGQAGGCWSGGQPRPGQALGRGAISPRGLAASRSDRKGTEPPLPWVQSRCYRRRVDWEMSLGVA